MPPRCPSLKIQALRTSLFKHFLGSTRRQDIPSLTHMSRDHNDIATFPMSDLHPSGFTVEQSQGAFVLVAEQVFLLCSVAAEVRPTRKMSLCHVVVLSCVRFTTIGPSITFFYKRCVRTTIGQWQRSMDTDRYQPHFWVKGVPDP